MLANFLTLLCVICATKLSGQNLFVNSVVNLIRVNHRDVQIKIARVHWVVQITDIFLAHLAHLENYHAHVKASRPFWAVLNWVKRPVANSEWLWKNILTRGRENAMQVKKIILLPALFFTVAGNATTSATNTSTTTSQSPRILVAYFSMQDGNTGDVARAIVEATGGDLYRIMVAEPYPADDKVRKELLTTQVEENILPALAGSAPKISEYDIIFLGSPVWANHLSQPVKSFLYKYDLSGKTVIPFVSHGGGGRGRSFSDVAELCDGCIVDTDGWSSWGGGRQRGIVKWIEKKLAQHKK